MEEEEGGEGGRAGGDVGDGGVRGDGDVFVYGWVGQGVCRGHGFFVLIVDLVWF